MAKLELVGACKSFGSVEVIRDVSMQIDDGEFVVLVGPSGCGKSTLLRMIAGLENVTAGDILIDGQRMNGVDPAERGTAMVFQSYALYPHMTVKENMGFGLRMSGTAKSEIEDRVAEVASKLQLEKLLSRKPKALSGGQRQRVAIGRAIVRQPRIFLFDEPLSNLDAELRVKMRVELAQLHQDLGTTMIYVTHDQVEAMTLADKIVVLRDGRVEQIGPPLELYQAPTNKFVAGFIGSPRMNFLDGRVEGGGEGHLDVRLTHQDHILLCLPVRKDSAAGVGDRVSIGIRPEQFHDPDMADHALEVKVSVVEHLGATSILYGAGDGEKIVWERKGYTSVKSSERLKIGIMQQDCHIFDSTGQALGLPPGRSP